MKKIKANFKDFLNENKENATLYEATLTQSGFDFAYLCEHLEDYLNPNDGIQGFIYYEDTNAFVKCNLSLILLRIRQIEEEDLTPVRFPVSQSDKVLYFNHLAWFTWVDFTNSVYSYLDNLDNLDN